MTLGLNVGTAYGGAERIAFEFVKRLDPERFRRHLCVTKGPLPVQRRVNEQDFRELEESGVEVLRLESGLQRPSASWVRLYRRLAGGSIDVLHSHMPRASVPGTIIGRLARVPVIVNHEHTWSFQGMPVRQFLDRNVVARGGDVVLAVSERDRTKMIEVERIPAESIRVMPNGIEFVPPVGHDVRGEFGVRPGVGLIGTVGRLYPQKGYGDLIRAVALLKGDPARPIRCVIVGYGPEEETLQALIEELDVAEEVSLVGHRQDVSDVIAAFDVSVLSSRYEGSPLAMMEYMAGASPIVATAVGGVPELIEDGVHGLLVQPCDPPALAAAIARLLDDRELATRLGQAARERQRAHHDIDVVVGQLEALYIELYERSRAARGN
jgi:glycosyltransferase involved in cell wall biosynthesis